MTHPDRYGSDVLSGTGDNHHRGPRVVTLAATADIVAEDPLSGFVGAVVACSSTAVTLEDRFSRRRQFPLTEGAFLVDGVPTTLYRPTAGSSETDRTASGSRTVPGLRARTARASRIWVEGVHDATLVERVWGYDLRVEGIVVEPLGGLDNLPAALAEFRPGPGRRVGVLADHLLPGTKESRIAAEAADPQVLVTGHPYVDIWQAVKPEAVGIAGWPEVARGTDWKSGVCAALGVTDVATMWGRINGAVSSWQELETPLIAAVEQLIDFVTAPDTE